MKELESGSKPAGGSEVSHTSFSPWLPRGWGVRSRGDSAVATEPSWSNVAKRSGKSDKARECDFIWNTIRESVSSDPEAAPIQNEAGSAIVATEHDATAQKSVIDDEIQDIDILTLRKNENRWVRAPGLVPKQVKEEVYSEDSSLSEEEKQDLEKEVVPGVSGAAECVPVVVATEHDESGGATQEVHAPAPGALRSVSTSVATERDWHIWGKRQRGDNVASMAQEDVVSLCTAMLLFRFKNVSSERLREMVHGGLQRYKCSPATLGRLSALAAHVFFDKVKNMKSADDVFVEFQDCCEIRETVLSHNNLKSTAHLSEDLKQKCEEMWSVQFLQHRLTEQQIKDGMKKVRYNDFTGKATFSRAQRSLISNMERKLLGDKTIAYTIWQIGLPKVLIFNRTLLPSSCPSEDFLQELVSDMVFWLQRWALAMERRAQQTLMEDQQRLGGQSHKVSPLNSTDQKRKRVSQSAANEKRWQTKLAKKRDSGDVPWEKMTDRQQQLVQKYDRTQEYGEQPLLPRLQRPGAFAV